MKRYLTVILCIVLVFLLWGCKQKTTPLTQDELEWFGTEFFADIDDIEEEVQVFNIRNMFLRCEFDVPENIDYEVVFREGLGEYDAVTQAEIDLYIRTTGNDIGSNYAKISKEDMITVFQANTGLHPDETLKIGLDKLVYLAEYDAYYHGHGGIAYGFYNIQSGERAADGTVKLYYRALRTGHNPLWCVTLKPAGDTYHFVSNLPAE